MMVRNSSTLFVLLLSSVIFAAEPELKTIAFDSVKDYVADTTGVELKRVEQPIVRFTTNGIDEGDIFLWTEQGRPAIAGQVFHLKNAENGLWLHEFQSLCTDPIILRRDGKEIWGPKSAGVEWQFLKTDVIPAPSERGRLTQFKQFARDFTGVQQTPGISESKEYKRFGLSLKPKEAYRYQSNTHHVLDGIIFWFSQEENSDPELLLMIEALSDGSQVPWRFALARMSCWPMQIDYQGKRVADFPNLLNKSTRTDAFHVWQPVLP